MKQYINQEQIEKLSFEKYEKLRDLLGMQNSVFSDKCSIGKMIEIIDMNWFIELNPPGMDSQYNFELKIIERRDFKSEYDYVYEEVYHSNELCDVLFQAVVDQCLI